MGGRRAVLEGQGLAVGCRGVPSLCTHSGLPPPHTPPPPPLSPSLSGEDKQQGCLLQTSEIALAGNPATPSPLQPPELGAVCFCLYHPDRAVFATAAQAAQDKLLSLDPTPMLCRPSPGLRSCSRTAPDTDTPTHTPACPLPPPPPRLTLSHPDHSTKAKSWVCTVTKHRFHPELLKGKQLAL